MAENEDRSTDDLSEEASPYRVEEQREKGQVAQSREVTALIALLAAGATTFAMSPSMGAQMLDFMRDVFRADMSARLNFGDNAVLGETMMKSLKLLVALCLPIAVIGFITGVLGSFAQIGSIFSTDPLTPDLKKIDPFSGLKRIFSVKNGFEALRLIIKLTAVVMVVYAIAKAEVFRSPSYIGEDPVFILGMFASSGKTMFFSLLGVLAIFAVADFGLQKWEYGKQVRVTKQEAKEEHKQREGSPEVKGRIKAVQREMARKRMMQAVRTADVIVTNPTHIAIAIKYDKEKMAAPKVVAKGADYLAQSIRKMASDAGVPLVENVPLARTLYKSVKVGQYVPRALYQAVAEVLAHVYRLRNRRF